MHRSCYERLRRIFNQGFTAHDVAEPLFLADTADAAPQVAHRMEEQGATHAGVLREGELVGFVEASDLAVNRVEDHVQPFESQPMLTDETPLAEAILAVEEASVAFLRLLGRPVGVLTRREFEKAPVRMWLFGSISLIEMAVTEAVRRHFPGERWMALVPEGRLQKAMTLWGERQRREQNVEPLECIQLADKVLVLLKDPGARKDMGFQSRRVAERRFKGIQSLRNNLAHVQPIVAYDWETIVMISQHLDRILDLVRDERIRGAPTTDA